MKWPFVRRKKHEAIVRNHEQMLKRLGETIDREMLSAKDVKRVDSFRQIRERLVNSGISFSDVCFRRESESRSTLLSIRLDDRTADSIGLNDPFINGSINEEAAAAWAQLLTIAIIAQRNMQNAKIQEVRNLLAR